MSKPNKLEPGQKLRDAEKLAHIPIKVIPTEKQAMLRKPAWMKVKLPASSQNIERVKQGMRKHNLHSVCEEASCPNLAECFHKGTATFMILGDICTRRCPFCDVAHGKPLKPDADEPEKLGRTIADMGLRYVVITSVDRDDLRDGGASHFAACVAAIRKYSPQIQIEILVPDFKGRIETALEALAVSPPDVFNHNLETIPRLYKEARPSANYQGSLNLLQAFKQRFPEIPTKSGLMVGLGEENQEILAVMADLRAHQVEMLTVGQYLQPSRHHLAVKRYVHPDEFTLFREQACEMGFSHAACGPLVRSSYHADKQAAGIEVK